MTYELRDGAGEPVPEDDFASVISKITGESNKTLSVKSERTRKMKEEVFPAVQDMAQTFAQQMQQAEMPVDLANRKFTRSIKRKGWFGAEHTDVETAKLQQPIWVVASAEDLAGNTTLIQSERQRLDKGSSTISSIQKSIAVTPAGEFLVARHYQEVNIKGKASCDSFSIVECGASNLKSLFGNYPESDTPMDDYLKRARSLFVTSAQRYATEGQATDTKLKRVYNPCKIIEGKAVEVNLEGWSWVI